MALSNCGRDPILAFGPPNQQRGADFAYVYEIRIRVHVRNKPRADRGGAGMTWLLVITWITGAALFAFSFSIFGLAAMRVILRRNSTRRIRHGQFVAPRSGPLRPGGFTTTAMEPSRRHKHRARSKHAIGGTT
jgi:hypothetical protein